MKHILILAPHLELPPRNGADLLVERNARFLASDGRCVIVLAARSRLTYVNEELTAEVHPFDGMRSRTVAGIRTILFRSNFFKEKFLTPSWIAATKRELRTRQYAAVVCSYIATASILTKIPASYVECAVAVWTHNDEFKWFRTLAEASTNPIRRLAAHVSSRWTRKFLEQHHARFLFVHVTKTDQIGFHDAVPDMKSLVQPVGTDIPDDDPANIQPGTPPTVIFVGSLGVTMNVDALEHFSSRFWPILSDRLIACSVHVVGSNPSDRIKSLCRENSWLLSPDVTDAELKELYRSATCAILPFPYATGAKLKLLGALAHGLPVFATSALSSQSDILTWPCVLSDSPDAWLQGINTLMVEGLSLESRKELKERTRPYSWKSVSHMLNQNLLPGHTGSPPSSPKHCCQ
ncbi:MAG: hypothetical protein COV99_11930 [Bacteroidetes bacterium CG12_big_fil_rev_8_21_14_0_65_60_17]|nr:MAG: hypothetical protein COV99_11930 [Bacteroidetes bacterium CG12_big_fil_rev_8_21_14_0_65_60_17]